MAPPLFIVNKHGLGSRRTKASRYTQERIQDEMWHVGLYHGFYVGQKIDLWFQTEPQADVFSLHSAYTQSEMIQSLGSDKSYVVRNVGKAFAYGQRNRYTNTPERLEAWRVSMENLDGDGLDLLSTVEKDIRRYNEGRSYTPLDIFGTMRSVPDQIAAVLLEQYRQRRAAEEQATPTAPTSPTAPTPTAPTTPTSPTVPEDTGGDGGSQPNPYWYTVTNGGAAGYYNGEYRASGTFFYEEGVLASGAYTPQSYQATTALYPVALRATSLPLRVVYGTYSLPPSGVPTSIAQSALSPGSFYWVPNAATYNQYLFHGPFEWYGVFVPA